MTAHKTYVLSCNVCREEYRPPTNVDSAGVARVLARSHGWAHRTEKGPDGYARSVDSCPRCSAADVDRAPLPSGKVVLAPELAQYAATILRGSLARGELHYEGLARATLEALGG